MSKIGKIFQFATDPLGLFKSKKKKTVFLAPTKKAVEKQTSEDETAARRLETAARLRSGRATAVDKDDEEEEVIRRAGLRRAKLLGG